MNRLDDLLARSARHHADVVAIHDDARSVTFAELAAEVERLAGGLHGLGVGPGHRVAVLGANSIAFAATYFAVARLGAVTVPINARLRPPEIRGILDDSGARVVLADAALVPQLGDTALPFDDPRLTGSGAPNVGTPSDVVVQMYTSGTTGRPKGAMLTHANLVHLTTAWLLDMPVVPARDRFLQVTPLFHIGALIILLCCVGAGITMRLLGQFMPGKAAAALEEHRITHTLMVPAMIRWLLDDPGSRGRAFPDLKLVAYGAAPIGTDLLNRAMDRLGCAFLQGYGLTETAGVLTSLRPEGHATHPLSAGRALFGVEVRVVDDDGVPLPPGEVGEIVARGPNVFVGYWGMPEATTAAFRDGWMRTGDLGHMDAAGFVTIVDRAKDMILVGGVNVYPREVEIVLDGHPGVHESAVIGVPDDRWGEAVLAVVVPVEGLDRAALLRHCRAVLAAFKCPSRFEVIDALPRNAAGKIRKDVLREPHWRGRDRRV